MTGEELLINMECIDSNLVEAAAQASAKKKTGWIKWGVGLIAALIAIMLLYIPEKGTVTDIGGLQRKYKAIPMAQAETEPVYPWEYLTDMERYTVMTLNGTQYRTRARTLDASLLGEKQGVCSFNAYDIYTDQTDSLEKTAFAIQGVSPSELVAVELGGEFCVFIKDSYSPPYNFGAFWDDVDLSSSITLENFTLFQDNNSDDRQTSHRLNRDTVLWQLLENCRSAPYLELERFHDPSIETVSFSVTSEKLGVYKHGFQITSDGYITTNLMEWGYVFQIGETAAREIINHIKENSTAAPAQQYYQFLYGTYVGKEDGYLLIDDSVLCVNDKDGIVFRVPADDIRISRTVDLGYVSVGDVVLVNFTGKIDAASGNVVSEPVSIQRGILSEGNIMVEE